MRILLDEDVHIKVAGWLSGTSHDVIRVPSSLKNGRVIELANHESRILITRDKDFSNRLMYPPNRHSGIIVLRIHPPQLDKLISHREARCPRRNRVPPLHLANSLTPGR